MEENEINQNENTKKVRLWFYVSGAFFVLSIILMFLISHFLNSSNNKNINTTEKVNEKVGVNNNMYPRLIDGVMVEEGNVNPPIIAVMIDNHVDARPPAGIEKANLIFEAEAEGGITRYLAIFSVDYQINEIGPIRSARPYFIDWAKEFSALYVHVGGSPVALVKLEKEKVFHINEFYNGSYFWRGEDKVAPHNVFSSLNNLKEYIDRNEITRNEFKSWIYVEEKVIEERKDSHEIAISFLSNDYSVKWKYDKENNYYIRFLAGIPHETKSNEIVTSKNVAIIVMDSEQVDDKLRLEMSNIGNGDAQVCHEGECQKGVWEKPDSKARTMFYNEDGSEISFVRGNTWVEVVKPDYKVEIF